MATNCLWITTNSCSGCDSTYVRTSFSLANGCRRRNWGRHECAFQILLCRWKRSAKRFTFLRRRDSPDHMGQPINYVTKQDIACVCCKKSNYMSSKLWHNELRVDKTKDPHLAVRGLEKCELWTGQSETGAVTRFNAALGGVGPSRCPENLVVRGHGARQRLVRLGRLARRMQTRRDRQTPPTPGSHRAGADSLGRIDQLALANHRPPNSLGFADSALQTSGCEVL